VVRWRGGHKDEDISPCVSKESNSWRCTFLGHADKELTEMAKERQDVISLKESADPADLRTTLCVVEKEGVGAVEDEAKNA
jgi:hypothetical protein